VNKLDCSSSAFVLPLIPYYVREWRTFLQKLYRYLLRMFSSAVGYIKEIAIVAIGVS